MAAAFEPASRFPHAPLTTVHLWYEGAEPVIDEPFVGFVDSPFAWCFDRTALTDDAPATPRHVSLVAPADRSLLEHNAEELAGLARQTLSRYAGRPVDRGVVAHRVVKEPHAALSLTPEVEAARPSGRTRHPGLWLAGDWIATGLPATMESAATSGHRAADELEAYLRGAA